jgi:hypothetical protein
VANKTNQWYLDSGATCHVTCHHKLLHNYQPSHSTINLVLGDNFKCRIKGTGTIHATIIIDSTMKTVMLTDMYYAPELAKNLVSTAQITKLGCTILINTTGCHMVDRRRHTALQGTAQGNMLVLPLNPLLPEQAYTTHINLSLNTLHQRFGHACKHHLHTMLKAKGIMPTTKSLLPCAICIKNKTTCKPIHKGPAVRSTTPMEQLHTDMCRPFPIATKTSKCYFISIINNTTHVAIIITIHEKSNVKAVLCSHLAVTPVDLKC